LLEVQTRVTPRAGGVPYRPVADGSGLPMEPYAEIAAGSTAGVPLLVGTNLEERKFHRRLDPTVDGISDDGLLARLSDVDRNAEAADNAWFEPADALETAATRVCRRIVGFPPSTCLQDLQRAVFPLARSCSVAFAEPTLLALAYSFEQASHHRRQPPTTPAAIPAPSDPRGASADNGPDSLTRTAHASGANAVPPSNVPFAAEVHWGVNETTREFGYDITVSGDVDAVAGVYLHRRLGDGYIDAWGMGRVAGSHMSCRKRVVHESLARWRSRWPRLMPSGQ
jgi:hypothetical protein